MSRKWTVGLIIGAFALTLLIGVVIVISGVGLFTRGRVGVAYPESQVSYEPAYGGDAARAVDQEYAVEAEEAAYPMEAPAVMATAGVATQGGGGEGINVAATDLQIDRLIIRNGNISISVTDTVAAKESIEGMITQMGAEGAFVVSVNEYGGGPGSPYISLQVRIPATRFDEVMDAIADLAAEGTVPTRNESAQDVTEEYVDVASRVESLEAARDRLLDLMEGAQTTEDLLQAEQQLTYREAEIESLKGRMNYLAESARLSFINIELQPYILGQPVDTRWRPAETIREAIDDLIDGTRNFVDGLLYFIVAILPWLVLIALVIYGIVRFIVWRVRAGRRKRAARAANVSSNAE